MRKQFLVSSDVTFAPSEGGEKYRCEVWLDVECIGKRHKRITNKTLRKLISMFYYYQLPKWCQRYLEKFHPLLISGRGGGKNRCLICDSEMPTIKKKQE